MVELKFPERSPDKRQVAEALFAVALEAVVSAVRNLPKNHTTGEIDVADVWEEYKFQLQREESVVFEFYEDTLRGLCGLEADKLYPANRRLLWAWTDAWTDWDDEAGEPRRIWWMKQCRTSCTSGCAAGGATRSY